MTERERTHFFGDGCVPAHDNPLTVAMAQEGYKYQEPVPLRLNVPQQYVNADTLSDEWLAKELLARCIPGWSNDSDHSQNTPARLVASLREFGDREGSSFTFTTFEATSDEMIILSGIPFYTLCAHHVVPFYGQAHIGYVPRDTIAGISKLGRAVKFVAKGLWVQEELTSAIHDFLDEKLLPRGLAVVLQAEHLCMAMRGVQMPGVITITNRMSGVFGDHTRTAKAEFMEMIKSWN